MALRCEKPTFVKPDQDPMCELDTQSVGACTGGLGSTGGTLAGNKFAVLLLLLGLQMFPVGCKSNGGGGGVFSSSSDRIEELHLFGVPIAVNIERGAGPQGFIIRVFASNSIKARGIPIRSGSLEVVMYDGSLTPMQLELAKPLRTWTFTAPKLAPYATQGGLGVGYELALNWEQFRPSNSRITVVARYSPKAGTTIPSVPSVIPVGSR